MVPETNHQGSEQRDHVIRDFWIIGFLFSWIIFGIGLIQPSDAKIVMMIFEIVPKFGFSISGLFMAYRGGYDQLLTLLRAAVDGLRDLKFIFIGFLFAVLLNFGAVTVHILLASDTLEGLNDISLSGFEIFTVFIYWVSFRIFLGGGLGEEFGLRGFVLPLMFERYGISRGTLYLGILWSFWHLPANIGGGVTQSILSIILQMVLTVPMAGIFSFLYLRSKHNLAMMIVFHGTLNGTNAYLENSLYPVLDNGEDSWIIFYLLFVLIAGLFSYFALRQHLGSEHPDL